MFPALVSGDYSDCPATNRRHLSLAAQQSLPRPLLLQRATFCAWTHPFPKSTKTSHPSKLSHASAMYCSPTKNTPMQIAMTIGAQQGIVCSSILSSILLIKINHAPRQRLPASAIRTPQYGFAINDTASEGPFTIWPSLTQERI